MKLIKSLLLVALFPVLSFSQANAPVYQGQDRVSAGAFRNDSLLGCVPFHVDLTTTPVLVVAGAGIVERICAITDTGSTTSAGFAAALDSSGITGEGVTTSIPAGQLIVAPVEALNLNATATNSVNSGCADFSNAPGQFKDGLVVSLSSTAVQAVGCYRLEAGNNPGP